MTRTIGTTVRGIRTPIVKEGDDLVNIVVEAILKAVAVEGFSLADRDVVGITESLVARAQGNYASISEIATDVKQKFGETIGVVFPILSRNRFALILKGIALTGKQVYLLLNYPGDEVGNHLMDLDEMEAQGINPYSDILTEARYRQLFGQQVPHPYTGIDYLQMYKDLAVEDNIHIILANDPRVILQYTDEVLVANVHERKRTKKILKEAGAKTVYGLDDLLTEPVNSHGYNPEFGLLGSNTASQTSIKLFPRNCQEIVAEIQQRLWEKTGKRLEVMVYGDGAFKDPYRKIWELADPVVSPGFTAGLGGTPNEIKLKYIADNELQDMNQEEMRQAIRQKIKNKECTDKSLGTTPRRITDLLGSLCDLTSGSGDKGTPVVLVQGYFDNYASE